MTGGPVSREKLRARDISNVRQYLLEDDVPYTRASFERLVDDLAEAERERDEQTVLAETRAISRRQYRERAEAAEAVVERQREALARIVNEFPDESLRGRGDYWAENLHRVRDIARAAVSGGESAE